MLLERCGFTRVEPLPYYEGPRLISAGVEWRLANRWPGLFAELCVAARA